MHQFITKKKTNDTKITSTKNKHKKMFDELDKDTNKEKHKILNYYTQTIDTYTNNNLLRHMEN